MARKQHATYADEYMYLKAKIRKIIVKTAGAGGVQVARLKKQAMKFVKRMLELEKLHKQMGWPHPETIDQIDPKALNEQLKKAEMPEPRAAMRPDGSLPKGVEPLPTAEPSPLRGLVGPDGKLVSKELPGESRVKTEAKLVTNPDGTLPVSDNTPKMLASDQPDLKGVNPDGTLVQAQMMEGSDPKFYSDDQVEKFFKNPEDEEE